MPIQVSGLTAFLAFWAAASALSMAFWMSSADLTWALAKAIEAISATANIIFFIACLY